jgi:hypothetical protein
VKYSYLKDFKWSGGILGFCCLDFSRGTVGREAMMKYSLICWTVTATVCWCYSSTVSEGNTTNSVSFRQWRWWEIFTYVVALLQHLSALSESVINIICISIYYLYMGARGFFTESLIKFLHMKLKTRPEISLDINKWTLSRHIWLTYYWTAHI